MNYSYAATVIRVHDGDTLDASIDLGLRTRRKDADLGFFLFIEKGKLRLHANIRLAACNAAELGTPGGDAAAANLQALMPVGSACTVRSHKPVMPIPADKYGNRWDADITLPDGTDLVPMLVAQQWLASWDGTGIKPVPPWPRRVP